jgi:acyl-CoA synthetase (AMP-forming)/AMP-acid ligase II
MAMMDVPLNAWLLFDHAPRHFADTEIVTRTATGAIHRSTYREFGDRSQQLMHALDRLGLERGDRVGTLAWNGFRHLECYFAIPCSGRVLHTLNLRLSPEDLAYIVGHAGDRAIVVDADLLPLLEKVQGLGGLESVEHVVVMGDAVDAPGSLTGLVSYEDLIADQLVTYPRPDIAESEPLGLCYTSGTTGRPKGAVYTHRSTFLHSLAVSSAAGLSIGPGDCVLPVVPMFHANAWGMPHAATAVGAKQVFTAGALDPRGLVDLLADEGVTLAAGVPTVWLEVADEVATRGGGLPELQRIVCGGSQPPRALIERYLRDFDIPILQAWGMTETSPLASISWPKERMRGWSEEQVTDVVRTQAGLPLPGVELTIRDDDGRDVAWDGETMGQLLVRGPWVVDGYLGGDGSEQFTEDGWFRTGDVAVGSPDGYFVIADRTKDLIKSGGEWISSVDMEGALMAMPGVVEAAVIAVPDPKWQERPLACLVPGDGCAITVEDVHAHLERSGFARWQLPERIELIDAVPRTSVGKFDKKVLRTRYST